MSSRPSTRHSNSRMVLVRVTRLPDLQIPSDNASSKMHHVVTEVLPQLRRAGSNGVSFSGVAVASDGSARCLGRESFSHRLGLSKHAMPSLSPLSLHGSSGPSSPIVKALHQGAALYHACGTAHRMAAQRRSSGSEGGGSRPPLHSCQRVQHIQQPCRHVQQLQPSRAAGASRSLHASPSRKRVGHPPLPHYGSLQLRSRALNVLPSRRTRVPCVT